MPQAEHSKSVYIVEDDLELSTVLDRVLKSIDDYVVLDWSTSAEEAIENIHSSWKKGLRRPYDLIVIDIFLDGDQSGLDLWNLCHTEYPDIPVVITSASRLGGLFPNKLGPSEKTFFLQKPFRVDECKKLFKTLLN